MAKSYILEASSTGDVIAAGRWKIVETYFAGKIKASARVFRKAHTNAATGVIAPSYAQRALRIPIEIATSTATSARDNKKRFARLETSNQNTGIVRAFFQEIAEDFKNAGPSPDGNDIYIFDADKPLFTSRENLGAFESNFYVVDAGGKLVPKTAVAGVPV